MKWSNIDFTQPVAIESRTIRLSLSLSLEYARPTIKHRAAIIFRLRSNRFQLRLTFRLKGYVRSLFRSATRISASAGNVPTCNDVPPTRLSFFRSISVEIKEKEDEDSRILAPYDLLAPRNSMFPFIAVRFKRRFSPHFHPRGTRSSCTPSVLAIVKENRDIASKTFFSGEGVATSQGPRTIQERGKHEREGEQVRLNKIVYNTRASRSIYEALLRQPFVFSVFLPTLFPLRKLSPSLPR